MSSNDGLKDVVSTQVDADGIWRVAFEAGREVGFKEGIDTCRVALGQIPRTPPASPTEQEKGAKAPLTTPVEELDFRFRTFNVLKREGIYVVFDIVSKTEQDLSEIRNLGSKGVDEIRAKLAELGYVLRAS